MRAASCWSARPARRRYKATVCRPAVPKAAVLLEPAGHVFVQVGGEVFARRYARLQRATATPPRA
jgi:hypothetical protein